MNRKMKMKDDGIVFSHNQAHAVTNVVVLLQPSGHSSGPSLMWFNGLLLLLLGRIRRCLPPMPRGAGASTAAASAARPPSAGDGVSVLPASGAPRVRALHSKRCRVVGGCVPRAVAIGKEAWRGPSPLRRVSGFFQPARVLKVGVVHHHVAFRVPSVSRCVDRVGLGP